MEIAADAFLLVVRRLLAANVLRFPGVFDILPPFTYDSLGFLARMVLRPSAPIRASMSALQSNLSSAQCSRTVGIHLRGGFVPGDFTLHENVSPTALDRVVQVARQLAEERDEPSNLAVFAQSKVCFVIAGDDRNIRRFVTDALGSWDLAAFDISAPEASATNVGKDSDIGAANRALQEWFILSTANTVIVQSHTSFGLSAGIFGGCRGFTVAEHRVINGYSCFPWYGSGICAQSDGESTCSLPSL
jgi:hypothetical protein